MTDVASPTRPLTSVLDRLSRTATLGPTVSFELYPPRSPAATETLWTTIGHLAEASPDFFSVTYGASGSSRETSRAVLQWILRHTAVPVVAHLTCIGAPSTELRAIAEQLVADGVRDFLALRGDPPAGSVDWEPHPQGLSQANQLVGLLREVEAESGVGPLGIGVAATPSALRSSGSGAPSVRPADGLRPGGGGVDRASLCGDLQALVAKQEAGADYAITQVFFELADYVRYVDAARAAGVTLPLLPGIVPLQDPRRLRRLEEISGVPVPRRILEALDSEADEDRRRAAGTAMGVELVGQVLAAGAPGVHLYTFNQYSPALDLLEVAHLSGRGTPAGDAPDLAGRPQIVAPLNRPRSQGDDHDRTSDQNHSPD